MQCDQRVERWHGRAHLEQLSGMHGARVDEDLFLVPVARRLCRTDHPVEQAVEVFGGPGQLAQHPGGQLERVLRDQIRRCR